MAIFHQVDYYTGGEIGGDPLIFWRRRVSWINKAGEIDGASTKNHIKQHLVIDNWWDTWTNNRLSFVSIYEVGFFVWSPPTLIEDED